MNLGEGGGRCRKQAAHGYEKQAECRKADIDEELMRVRHRPVMVEGGLERLMPSLNPAVNLEFNAHFLDVALATGQKIVECPITFYPRVGVSKGGNVNDRRALRVGLRMKHGLCFGWPAREDKR